MARFWRVLLVVLLFATPYSAGAEALKKPPRPRHPPRSAPVVQRLGAAAGWTAYTYKGHSGQVCYITGFPSKREPANSKRKEVVMMVTHRPAEHVTDVVSFDEGYAFKDGSDAALAVDGSKFDLFTNGDTAWSRTSEIDKAIVAAMAKGNRAVITGTPVKGPAMVDTYDLDGFSHALALIDKACGVGR